jgi:hypothetical protein
VVILNNDDQKNKMDKKEAGRKGGQTTAQNRRNRGEGQGQGMDSNEDRDEE